MLSCLYVLYINVTHLRNVFALHLSGTVQSRPIYFDLDKKHQNKRTSFFVRSNSKVFDKPVSQIINMLSEMLEHNVGELYLFHDFASTREKPEFWGLMITKAHTSLRIRAV